MQFPHLKPAALAVVGLIFAAGPVEANDLSPILKQNDVDPARAALLVERLEDGARWSAGGARIETRFSPASSSKIPHTLVALESGLAKGPEAPFPWDGVERSIANWNQDQTLATAFSRSAVWVYQEIASRLGHATMRDWIARFDYGNRDVGGASDLTTYWLRGPLAISAAEQVAFLKRLVTRDLPLSKTTYDMADRIMRADAGEGWTLHAKTGWVYRKPEVGIGWYVGWLKSDRPGAAGTYLFAHNMDMPNGRADLKKRIAVVRDALTEIGALPGE